VKLSELASGILAVFGEDDCRACPTDRRKEPRRDFLGRKIVIRQRRANGIMHLRNVSRGGLCGITDMPLAIGSLVFLELKRPHFYAAEVVWASNLRIGLALARPLRPEMLERLHADYLAGRKVG
jgi:hypothetical protein